MSDIESKDFFRDDQLVNDPYLYLAAMRTAPPRTVTTSTSRHSSCAD